MPLELLKRLLASDMPVVLKDHKDVDKLRVLRAAGMVVADIMDEGARSRAVVHEVTPYGQIAVHIEEDPTN